MQSVSSHTTRVSTHRSVARKPSPKPIPFSRDTAVSGGISRKGFSTVEVIVVSAIIMTVVAAITVSYQAFFALARSAAESTQASLLLEEGAEALIYMRDMGWEEYIESLALETDYALVWDGAMYQATTTLPSGDYMRTVQLSEVRRNGSDVVSASGSIDPETRQALIVVRNREGVERARGTMLIHNAYAE